MNVAVRHDDTFNLSLFQVYWRINLKHRRKEERQQRRQKKNICLANEC
jgi:hypothetical protein